MPNNIYSLSVFGVPTPKAHGRELINTDHVWKRKRAGSHGFYNVANDLYFTTSMLRISAVGLWLVKCNAIQADDKHWRDGSRLKWNVLCCRQSGWRLQSRSVCPSLSAAAAAVFPICFYEQRLCSHRSVLDNRLLQMFSWLVKVKIVKQKENCR